MSEVETAEALSAELPAEPSTAPASTPSPTPEATGGPGVGVVRLALMLDGTRQAAWVERVLRTVIDAGWARIDLVILNDTAPAAADGALPPAAPARARGLSTRAGAWYANRRRLLLEAYRRLDKRRYPSANDAHAPADLTPLLAGVPVVRVSPRRTVHCDYFDDAAVEAIRAHDVDVALRFGFRILKGKALAVARYGVWSFHHGDNRVNRGGPAGFWEVMEGHPVTGAILQTLTEELDGGVVLARSFSRTEPASVNRNRNNYYWQASRLLVDAVRRLATLGPDAVAREAPEWSAYGERLYVAPTPQELARGVAGIARRVARAKLHERRYDQQWLVGYRFAPGAKAGGAGTSDAGVPDATGYRYKELRGPAGTDWADPFPVRHEGKYLVFLEEKPAGGRGHISVVELDPKTGPLGEPVPVLRDAHHLSYPAVFRWQGDWYMTPECATARAVRLYRAAEFPHRWELVGELLTGAEFVDATLFEHDGRWWMFVGEALPGANEATALHLYHAGTPLGPWTAHPLNPLKIDVRDSRPAGRVFTQHGQLYRPAQVGVPAYGSATVVHRIDELTPTAYRETQVSRLDPHWRPGLVCTHTLNAADALTVVDMRQLVRR